MMVYLSMTWVFSSGLVSAESSRRWQPVAYRRWGDSGPSGLVNIWRCDTPETTSNGLAWPGAIGHSILLVEGQHALHNKLFRWFIDKTSALVASVDGTLRNQLNIFERKSRPYVYVVLVGR
ncbi:hypothetical protein F5Y07DRAFT_20599 [Xylaria sp. FL0933]|nr:hypothetical protein F5Y07DRAFT_20599 [Xylaria sp. FL0933]